MAQRVLTKSRDIHPWDKYFNGKEWKFEQGIDYQDWPIYLIKKLRYQAKKRGLRINVTDKSDDSFTIVAHRGD